MPPQRYCIVVEGELGARFASAFEGMTVQAHEGVTDITGPVSDPSHLYGLLERLAGLGLQLRSVTPIDTAAGTSTPPRSSDI
jgi:hypothetical protein